MSDETDRADECRIEAPCGLCRLRIRAEAAERRSEAYRRALLEANRGRRKDRARNEARERNLEARGFERPGPDAQTVGDLIGLRRLPEVTPESPTPEVES